MEKPNVEPSLPGASLGSYSLQCSHHQQLQQGASRMTFTEPLQSKTVRNVTTGSTVAAGAAPHEPLWVQFPVQPWNAEQPWQGCLPHAPEPCTSQD